MVSAGVGATPPVALVSAPATHHATCRFAICIPLYRQTSREVNDTMNQICTNLQLLILTSVLSSDYTGWIEGDGWG